MCGIVGATAQRDVQPILMEGLKRLEYRGYDSAGIAILDEEQRLQRVRVLGKVADLGVALQQSSLAGANGIAHTRWATHGRPSVENAHPHICRDRVALVHNGIIENHARLRQQQQALGYEFESDTDTEVVVNQVHLYQQQGMDLLAAVRRTVDELRGAFALAVICNDEPDRMVVARSGSPLVIGIGIGEYFVASDIFALLPVTRRFIPLQEGDIADIRLAGVQIYDQTATPVQRAVVTSELSADVIDKGGYRHYMLKEIFSQAQAVADTIEGRADQHGVDVTAFGAAAPDLFARTTAVKIIACGTSYHAGLIAQQWLEAIAGVTCSVELASEFRYRKTVVAPGTLFVAISQSGETADTLGALRLARERGYAACLAICNVPESTLTRESDLVFLTRAGPEIGVASTKAFTTQLVALLLLVAAIARQQEQAGFDENSLVQRLEHLPGQINQVLTLDTAVKVWAERFVRKHHALYLGRGTMFPVAMEGALKLKEISYVHAEAYPAGELKHGPLALVDADMPVIAVAPNVELLGKLMSNLHEVRARGGELFVFGETGVEFEAADELNMIRLQPVDALLAPVIYTIPLQLLAYHVAVLKGADVDQPRNLAKSVTVE